MTDRICLNEMVFYGYHGVLPEERALGQRYVVDVEIGSDLQEAGQADDLSRTVNYVEVYRTVEGILTGPSCQLIETLAERIAAEILQRFDRVDCVEVRVRKPAPPIPGAWLGSSEVRIERSRSLAT